MPTEFQRRGQEARLAGLPRHYEPSPIDGETGHALMRTEFAQGWDEVNDALRIDTNVPSDYWSTGRSEPYLDRG